MQPEVETDLQASRSVPSLITLPNGSALRYALPSDKGNSNYWYRTLDLLHVREWSTKIKERNIKLGLWTSKTNQHVIAADFDKLPTGFDEFDALASYLSHTFGNRAVVVRSISGKVKAFFVAEIVSGMHFMTDAIAIDLLRRELTGELFDCIDKSHSALSISFLNPVIISELKTKLPNTIPIKAEGEVIILVEADNNDEGLLGSGGSTLELPDNYDHLASCSFDQELEIEFQRIGISKNPAPSKNPFRLYSGNIPPCFERFIHKSSAREQFIRILLESPKLLSKDGFEIPITKVARELNVSPKAVSNWRRLLVKFGFLEQKCRAYRIGQKSMAYAAANELLDAIREIHRDMLPALPSKIENGSWHATLWRVSSWFPADRPDEFIKWVKTIPGWDKKDRLEMAYDAIKSRLLYMKKK